jgi:CheY-like chemotaxis protein
VSSKRRRRALIASRPKGRQLFREMLGDSFDIVPVLTIDEALEALESEPRMDLILATLAFDESRMIELLQAVKRDRKLRDIPFFCCRVVKGVVTDELMAKMAAVCKAGGAEDFVDVAKLPRREAAKALKKMLGA